MRAIAETNSWLSAVDLIAASTPTSRMPATQGFTNWAQSAMKTVSGLSGAWSSAAIPTSPTSEAPARQTTTQPTPIRRARGISLALRMLMKRARMCGWPK